MLDRVIPFLWVLFHAVWYNVQDEWYWWFLFPAEQIIKISWKMPWETKRAKIGKSVHVYFESFMGEKYITMLIWMFFLSRPSLLVHCSRFSVVTRDLCFKFIQSEWPTLVDPGVYVQSALIWVSAVFSPEVSQLLLTAFFLWKPCCPKVLLTAIRNFSALRKDKL